MTEGPGYTGWRQFFAKPGLTRWLWVVTAAFSLPCLLLGHVLDDLQQQAMLRGTYDSVQRSATDLYCFSMGPKKGTDPALLSWWDYDESALCFLRPISSVSLWIDHKWLWEHPGLTHLHSLLWFMLLWFGWRRIFMRYLPIPITNLALLLTAMSGFVTMTVGWIASRHALVGGCFAVWGLYHCLAARDDPTPTGSVTSPVRARPSAREIAGWAILVLGMLSSEMVLGVFGFLVAREWLSRTAKGDLRAGSRARIVAYAAFGVAYVAVHGALGYGAPKYPMYLDPFGDPLTFLRAAPERLIGLAGDLILGVSAELWLYPFIRPFVAVLALFALAMLAVSTVALFREAPEPVRGPLRWLGVGALLSLAPCVSGMQGGRTLSIAGFPLFAVIAACLMLLPRELSANAARRGGSTRRAIRKLAWTTLAVGAFIGNPSFHLAWYAIISNLDQTGEKALDETSLSCPGGSDVYLIDASQVGASAWYARFWLKDRLGANHFRQLTMIPTGIDSLELVRTGPASLTLRANGGTLLSDMAVPQGSEVRFQPGFSREYADFNMHVDRIAEHGPVELSFDFARDLDAPDMCLFVQDDLRLYQIKPPAIGRTLSIKPPSPLSGTPLESLAQHSVQNKPGKSQKLRRL